MDQNWNQHLSFQENKVLFGRDATPSLLAFEVEGHDRIRIYSRKEGSTISEVVPFRPFLLVQDEKWLKDWKGESTVERLEGSAPFNRLVQFADVKELESAKFHLQKKT